MGGGVEEEVANIASLPGNISGVNTGRNPSFTSLSENGKEQDNLPETSSGPGPPPNGGLRAWQQVLGAFFLNFNTWYDPLDGTETPDVRIRKLITETGVWSILLVSSKTITPVVLSSQLLSRQSLG